MLFNLQWEIEKLFHEMLNIPIRIFHNIMADLIHIDFAFRNDVSFVRRTVIIIENPCCSTILIEVKRNCY